ncbi:MAG TPA: hypothetical protein VGG18_12670 [Granulicella sp.]
MVFRGPLARTESLDISAVKRLEVHVTPSITGMSGVSVHRPSRPFFGRDDLALKRKWLGRHYSATPSYGVWKRMDESMQRTDEKRNLPDATVESSPRRWTMLRSLRIVPVTSEHFLGRRYVMELATASRARELRVFRSLEQLMAGLEELGLRVELREDLQRQLIEEGCCQLLDIVL